MKESEEEIKQLEQTLENSKFKPILSFSAYHNESDKEVLPKLVKSIRKDYKIDLNTFSEEVFYCY